MILYQNNLLTWLLNKGISKNIINSKQRGPNPIKDSIKQYFNDIANQYNIKHGVNFFGSEWGIHHYYLPLIKQFIPKGVDILEIGCGTGKFTEILKKRAKRICSTDIVEKMLEIAKKKNPNVDFFIGDGESLESVSDSTFDVVVTINTFSYFQDKAKALQSIRRVLRKDGIFFNLDMNGLCPIYFITKRNKMRKWYGFIKENTLDNLRLLFKHNGFEVIYENTLCWVPNSLNKMMGNLFALLDFILNLFPFINKFAMRIVIVGRKQ